MTRINLIKPIKLNDKHLLAEIRELPRVFSYVKKYGVNKKRIKTDFTLNQGHILFFTNKLKFLFNRYCLLHQEAITRGFNINYTIGDLYYKYSHLMTDKTQTNYTPTIKEIKISQERINEKLLTMFYNKYGVTTK